MRVHLLGSGALGRGVWHGVETPRFSGVTFAAEISSLQNLSLCPWEQSNPFCVSVLPTSLDVASVTP